jgi:hypothetical protein
MLREKETGIENRKTKKGIRKGHGQAQHFLQKKQKFPSDSNTEKS